MWLGLVFLKFYFKARERPRLAAPGKNNAFLNHTKYITEEAVVETSLEKAKNMMEGTLSGEKKEIHSCAVHVPDLSVRITNKGVE